MHETPLTTVGRYRLLRLVGRGGMGEVYEADDPVLGRRVAVKLLSDQLREDPMGAERFEREAATLARLDSLHIIPIYDYGIEGGRPFLVTKFVAGGDLESRLRQRGSLAARDAVNIVKKVCDALGEAHGAGVLHRDVKPANVLLGGAPQRATAYLCDFGIAHDRRQGLTTTGTVVGSLRYMAPERHLGTPATVASDIYATGCLLWAALTGDAPYDGTELTVGLAHLHDPVPELDDTRPWNGELNRILALSMAKDPSERYESAKQMGDALDRLSTRMDRADDTSARTPRTPNPTVPRSGVEATVVRPRSVPASVAHAGGRASTDRVPARRTVLLVGAVITVLLVGAISAVLINRDWRGSSPPAARTQTGSESGEPLDPSATTGDTSGVGSRDWRCFDGQTAAEPTNCPTPSGLPGLHWTFPRSKQCQTETRFAFFVAARTCNWTSSRGYTIFYGAWPSLRNARAHYVDDYGTDTNASWSTAGERVGAFWERTNPGDYKASVLYADYPFSVSVRANSADALEDGLSYLRRTGTLRAPSRMLASPT